MLLSFLVMIKILDLMTYQPRTYVTHARLIMKICAMYIRELTQSQLKLSTTRNLIKSFLVPRYKKASNIISKRELRFREHLPIEVLVQLKGEEGSFSCEFE